MTAALHRLGTAAGSLLVFLFWIVLSPLLYLILWITHWLGSQRTNQSKPSGQPLFAGQQRPACSIIIPTWNGKDLLEQFLPSVFSECRFDSGDELIVVDNASSDGTAELLAECFPQVRHLALPENRGFGEGCNTGIRAARNSVVVLLNNDMRVAPGFLQKLIEPFRRSNVFAVSSQILFSDPAKRREESGLTYARFRAGQVELGHDVSSDPSIPTPCFYPGGGSSAFHRERLLELGGFDRLYQPFYLEDTDLGFEAWRRGWLVLYQPESIVYHEHRGTIGKRFDSNYIDGVIAKNRLLFQWKHLHSATLLFPSFLRHSLDLMRAVLAVQGHPVSTAPKATLSALAQLPLLLRQRHRSAASAVRSDKLALTLHQPDIFFDRCEHRYTHEHKLRLLLVSPYPLFPARHGGAVLITQALDYLCALCDVHLIVVLESENEREAHLASAQRFASMHLIVRRSTRAKGRFGLVPKAVREFDIPDLQALISRLIHQHRIDVIQLEYTNMAQYAKPYTSIVTSVFEHDVYFQTVARRILTSGAAFGPKTILEYLRALRYEIRALQSVDYIQVCSDDNGAYLRQFVPSLNGRVDANLRAGIRLSAYNYSDGPRLPDTLLFVGNFRHTPNREGLAWLLDQVMPKILESSSQVTLRVVGANTDCLDLPSPLPAWLDLRGEVVAVQPHLAECAVFVCPVLTGSGVRVKLLEAFAAGIPVVSTTIGAEGLSGHRGAYCHLADEPETFARAVLEALRDGRAAQERARLARAFVEQSWSAEANTKKVEQRYREFLARKQRARQTVQEPLKV